MSTKHLEHLAQAYSRHTGLKISTVGSYAVNDGKFFLRLKDGASCTLRTAYKATAWFHENWPADLEWPSDIPRPAPQSKKEAAQ